MACKLEALVYTRVTHMQLKTQVRRLTERWRNIMFARYKASRGVADRIESHVGFGCAMHIHKPCEICGPHEGRLCKIYDPASEALCIGN